MPFWFYVWSSYCVLLRVNSYLRLKDRYTSMKKVLLCSLQNHVIKVSPIYVRVFVCACAAIFVSNLYFSQPLVEAKIDVIHRQPPAEEWSLSVAPTWSRILQSIPKSCTARQPTCAKGFIKSSTKSGRRRKKSYLATYIPPILSDHPLTSTWSRTGPQGLNHGRRPLDNHRQLLQPPCRWW